MGIRFRPAGKVYSFDSADIECAPGDRVIVETDRGMALGFVATTPAEPEGPEVRPLKKLLRLAETADVERFEENRNVEAEARRACIDLVIEKKLDMKLLSVESLFDRSKLLFFFAAEGRIDFRELVRDLARQFHTRIEMRQVGVRDEAKMIGGLGCCGRELCCATWMLEFAPISVRMAKSQNISLNPAKISGICGRLMCCLSFENKMYEDLSKNMPKIGKKVETPRGEGKVVRRNALEGTFVVQTSDGEHEISVDDFLAFKNGETPVKETPERKQRPEQAKPRQTEPSPAEEEDGEEAEGEEEAASEGGEPASGEPERHEQKKSGRRRRRRRKKPPQGREEKADG